MTYSPSRVHENDFSVSDEPSPEHLPAGFISTAVAPSLAFHTEQLKGDDVPLLEERRVDPSLNDRELTYFEMCKGLQDQEFTEEQLRAHWASLRLPGSAHAACFSNCTTLSGQARVELADNSRSKCSNGCMAAASAAATRPDREARLKWWSNWKEAVRRENQEACEEGYTLTYQECLSLGRDAAVCDAAADSRGTKCIWTDLGRTRLGLTEQEKICLERVLLAYAGYDCVGYTQPMSLIVAMLVVVGGTEEEEEIFGVLKCLMEKYGLKEFCRDGPMVNMYVSACKRMVERKLPKLHKHFEALGAEVNQSVYHSLCVKWFSTLFVGLFPAPVVATIWDIILSKRPTEQGGLLDALRMAYAVFEINESTLLHMKDFDQVARFFRTMRTTSADKTDGLNYCWLDFARQACSDIQIEEDFFHEFSMYRMLATIPPIVPTVVACSAAAVIVATCSLSAVSMTLSSAHALPTAAMVDQSAAPLMPIILAGIVPEVTTTLRGASRRLAAPFKELAADAAEAGSMVLLTAGLLRKRQTSEAVEGPQEQRLAISCSARLLSWFG